MKHLIFLLPLLACVFPVSGEAVRSSAPARSPWESSIITIEIARNQFDYNQPWSRKTRRLKKTGVVVDSRHVLTTADQLSDRTLLRFQKFGRGQWFIGELEWVDYPANLALLTCTDSNFWKELKPAVFDGSLPENAPMQILRWNDGNLENRRAEFEQYTVREGPLSPVSLVVLQSGSDIQGVGWGEPVVSNSHVLGLLMSQEGRNTFAITASYVKFTLEAVRKKEFRGLGYFHFYWQPAENPATLAALNVPGEPRGVIVHFVPDRPDGAEQVLRTNDVILSIDGFTLDTQGDYPDPEYGYLLLENLAVRGKWAGTDVPMRIWRDGKELDVTYRLPKYEYSSALLPFATPDQEPEYLVTGGFVFQPFTDPFLQTWGQDWKRRAPFRLYYFNNQYPTKDRPALVIMSQVLPDPFNIGYQDLRYLVLDKVNGMRVNYLTDLREALKKPNDGFHRIEFIQSDNLRRVVIAAGDLEEAATDRVLKRYGIGSALHLNSKDTQH